MAKAPTTKPSRRGHGEGSISKRKDGRWEAKVPRSLDSGSTHRQSIYGKTRREVADKLAAALKAQQDGVPFVPANQTVETFFNDWLAAARTTIRETTHHRYEQYVRLHIVPAIGKIRLAKLTAQHLRRLYEQKLSEKLAPQTVLHLHRVIHRGLNQAMRWDLVTRNVSDLVDPPRPIRKQMTTLSAEQVQTLFATARDDRLHALYVLAITTGMRQGELLALHWRDLNLRSGTARVEGSLQPTRDGRLKIVEPKTAKSRRQVTLTATALDALRRHRVRQAQERLRAGEAWSDQDLLFPDTVGQPMRAGHLVRQHFYPMLAKAELPRIRFHDLRHTAATLLLEGGVNTKVVSEMLGHTSVSITMDLYQHVTPTMQQAAADAMDRVCMGLDQTTRG